MHGFHVFHSNEEVASLGERLLDRSLPKAEWTHGAHFAVTLWLLRERPDIDVARDLPALIRAYNVATGVANTAQGGYHETITRASLRAARAFLARHPSLSLVAGCNALLTCPFGRSEWLFAYRSRARLFSPQARQRWCDPDVAELPF